MDFSIAVLGAGPIGAATTWHLSRSGVPGVASIARAEPHPDDTFRQSGGSVCWHRPDPEKARAIQETADFIRAQAGAGAPIRYRDEPYLFLEQGELVPALNVTATDVVDHLRNDAAGVTSLDLGEVHAVEACSEGYRVTGDRGSVTTRVAVLALGTNTRRFVPGLTGEVEKRSLMVLDLPVGAEREGLPHLVMRLGEGYVFTFVKEIEGRLRLVLGQEDLIVDDLQGPVDHLPELLRLGLGERLPYLVGAQTERILWGTDWVGKTVELRQDLPGLLTMTCGSAVRSCYALGRLAAEAAHTALRQPAW